MTTTAAAWRHVDGDPCTAEADDWSGATGLCGCTTPTPDPASPCSLCDKNGYATVHATDRPKGRRHPHIPTRCTCGHALEAVR